ncbi:YqaJ viral recombinase family nuclease [Anaerotignum sp.]|uniref:YqaJ viral recombinase family nuclease n=1 Tax=Anaerotignum sp. TaxID=2039241 RepID=UPI0028AB066C|nr:YqaJ viral recombinase family protein [Anaerotignum sp.]
MPEFVLPYEPLVITSTVDLPREEWLSFRKTGIGGSEVAAVFGISPFGTARDVYYDKLNIASAFDDEANKYQKKIGSLLEDVVAEMFSEVTGYPVFQIQKMFRSREHYFMLADVDYFVLLSDGSYAILECKTTSPDATDKWWNGTEPAIPLNYQLQGRQYMSVMHISKVFYACLHGNSENYLIIREMNRDLEIESEMIVVEQHFWENHILLQIPPPYIEEGDLIIESARRHFGYADTNAPEVVFDVVTEDRVLRYLELQQQKTLAESNIKEFDKELQRMKGLIIAEMGTCCTATCSLEGVQYQVTYNPIRKSMVSKENLVRLQAQHPDIYEQYVTVSESRRFYVKEQREIAA